jgi:hypothetical protein
MIEHPDLSSRTSLDGLSEHERRALLGHVSACPRCREALAGDDPSRLLALLALASPPQEAMERLSARVAGGVDRLGASRRGRGAGFVASIAATLLLAAILGGYLVRQGPPAPPAARPVANGWSAAAEPAPGGVELISSPGEAQVVELSIGGTQVVMIFDEALDI